MIKPTKRISRTGEISYLLRVNLGFANGEQIIKAKTWKPDRKMTPKQMESEVVRQLVLFEEQAKQEYQEQLKHEAELQQQRTNKAEYDKQHITFKDLADKWLALQISCNELKPSSITKLKGCRERTYNAIGDILVSQLDFLTIQDFISSLAKKGVNRKTGKGLGLKSQKSYLNFISDVMKFAKKCKLVTDIPCSGITFTQSDTKEKKVYSLNEAKQLLQAINEKAPTQYKLLYTLLAYCGMRKGEALGLEYKDIDFDKSILSINRTSNYHEGYGVYTDTPKTKNSYRSLFIQPKLLNMIQQLRAEQKEQAIKCGDQWVDSDRLFINWQGKPLHPNIPYKWLKRFCESENIPFKALHGFRHFTATQALANGVDVKRVSDMLGHANPTITLNTYIHAVQQANEDALNCVADLLDTA